MPERQQKDLKYEERLQKAIRAVQSGQESSVAAASESFEVNRRTLYRRLAGTTVSAREAHEEQQRLTAPEEKAVVKFCFDQDDKGFPPRLDMVKDMALFLEEKRTGVNPPPIGRKWVKRFLQRHAELTAKLSTQLERQRSHANDPKLIQDYFTKLGRLMRKYGITSCEVFNMDEKGFLMGRAARAKVLCRRGRRNPRVTHDGQRELVTVIETVCGNGHVLSPFVINKGAGHYLGWYKNLTEREKDYKFSYSARGWTDDELALEWLKRVFEPESSAICGNRPRLLILDGHGSHITYEFVRYCDTHNIHLLCLPAHSTHLLQPLDVGLFSPYQHFYGLAVDDYMRSGQNIYGIKKSLFIPFLTKARDATFTPHNVSQAFACTGIWPLNPRRVLGKIAPTSHKRRDTLGVVKTPRTSSQIRHRVKAATKLLDGLAPESSAQAEKNSQQTLDRVKSVLTTLGHQLEEEIAEKEIWQNLAHKLQHVDPLFNQTDRRKLSEAKVLDGSDLSQLRDARLEKDQQKKQSKRAQVSKAASTRRRPTPSRRAKKTAPPASATTPHPRAMTVTISSSPQIVLIDSGDYENNSESEIEELTDSEWNSLSGALEDMELQEPDSQAFSSRLRPDRPLHMTLRSRGPASK